MADPVVPLDAPPQRPRQRRFEWIREWIWPSCDTAESARRAVLYAVFANVLKLSAIGGPLIVVAIDNRAAAIGLLTRGAGGIDLLVTAVVVILLLRHVYAGALAGLFWALFNRAYFYAGVAAGGTITMEPLEIILFHVVPLLMLLFHLHGVRGTYVLRQIRRAEAEAIERAAEANAQTDAEI